MASACLPLASRLMPRLRWTHRQLGLEPDGDPALLDGLVDIGPALARRARGCDGPAAAVGSICTACRMLPTASAYRPRRRQRHAELIVDDARSGPDGQRRLEIADRLAGILASESIAEQVDPEVAGVGLLDPRQERDRVFARASRIGESPSRRRHDWSSTGAVSVSLTRAVLSSGSPARGPGLAASRVVVRGSRHRQPANPGTVRSDTQESQSSSNSQERVADGRGPDPAGDASRARPCDRQPGLPECPQRTSSFRPTAATSPDAADGRRRIASSRRPGRDREHPDPGGGGARPTLGRLAGPSPAPARRPPRSRRTSPATGPSPAGLRRRPARSPPARPSDSPAHPRSRPARARADQSSA